MSIHKIYTPAHDNDALIPEIWAQEALMQLENNMVMGNLVHRDFENEIAQFGDTVNAHRPAVRKPTRKTDADDVNSTATDTANIPVVLNQHIYDSFIIKDGEESLSFKDLVATHLTPSIQGMAQFVDQLLCTQVYNFIGANSVGKLGVDVGKSTLIGVRERANDLKWGQQGRNLIMPSAMEASLLDTDLFVGANTVGDEGSALREGNLGRKFGINTFMDQNAPSVAAGNTTKTGAVNNAAGYQAGATTVTVDGFSAAIAAGSWFTIAGDMTPQRVVSTVGGAIPTSIVFTPGLRHAVADNAVVTSVTAGAINLGAGYDANYSKDIVVDGFTISPKTGQLASIAQGVNHGILESRNGPSTTSLMFDRPLAAAAADNAVVGIGPAGNFGFALKKEALAFVSRPLAAPKEGTGARSFVANYNGLAIRVVITYDGVKQGHRVTVDMLGGVATLDSRLAFPVYG